MGLGHRQHLLLCFLLVVRWSVAEKRTKPVRKRGEEVPRFEKLALSHSVKLVVNLATNVSHLWTFDLSLREIPLHLARDHHTESSLWGNFTNKTGLALLEWAARNQCFVRWRICA